MPNELALQSRIRTLIDALGRAEEDVRRSARTELADIGRDAVGALIETLRTGNEKARWEAAFTLWKIGPEAAEAVPALTEVLQEASDFPLRGMVINALGAIGPRAADAVPELIHDLGHPIPLVSRGAAKALGKIKDARAISALELACIDEPPPLCDDAADSLAKIEVDLPERISGLIDKFRASTEDEHVERCAAGELIYFGGRAIPALIEALGDRNEDMRYFAALALRGIGQAENAVTDVPLAVPALIRAIQDSVDESVRHMAAEALGAFGEGGVAGVAVLIDAMDDPDGAVRESAVTSLGLIGAIETIPALERATGHRCGRVRRAARKALKQIRDVSA